MESKEHTLQQQQQQQNDDIVKQFREYLQHVKDNYKLGEHPDFTFYGYALILHVDSGIIPKLSADGDYLSLFCVLLRQDMAVHGADFVNHTRKSVAREISDKLLYFQDGIKCLLSTVDKTHLNVNVITPAMELDKYKTLVTRLVAFLQHVAVQSDVVLDTVVITCAALKQKFFHLGWLERDMKKPLPRPFTLYDFSRPLTVYEEDHDIL